MAKNTDPISVGTVPQEALSEAGINETPPEEQRTNKSRSKLGKGAKVGEHGEYTPASYKTLRGNIREDR